MTRPTTDNIDTIDITDKWDGRDSTLKPFLIKIEQDIEHNHPHYYSLLKEGWIVDRGLDIDIEVDGGVKADWTIAACADAGANCFIAGSGMFKYDDLAVGCSELRTIAEAAQNGKVLKEGESIKDLEAVAA